jgi:hypothetical protein
MAIAVVKRLPGISWGMVSSLKKLFSVDHFLSPVSGSKPILVFHYTIPAQIAQPIFRNQVEDCLADERGRRNGFFANIFWQ